MEHSEIEAVVKKTVDAMESNDEALVREAGVQLLVGTLKELFKISHSLERIATAVEFISQT